MGGGRQADVRQEMADLKAAGFSEDYVAYIQERIKYWTEKAVPEADAAAWVAENVKSPSAK